MLLFLILVIFPRQPYPLHSYSNLNMPIPTHDGLVHSANIRILVFRIHSKYLQNETLVNDQVRGVGRNSGISSNSVQCNKEFVFSSWGLIKTNQNSPCP